LNAAGELTAPALPTQAAPGVLRDRILHVTLFVTILSSPVVFIEPAPYEALAPVLALAAVIAGVSFDRRLLPLFVLVLIWSAGGAASLIPVVFDSRSLNYAAVSFYLQMTAVLFACFFADDTLRRLETLRRAYLIAAVFAAVLGILGYFHVFGAELLTDNDRARATFKDPNVFGPFLILPLLLVIERVLQRGLRLRDLVPSGIMLIALFLSFSRGAWGHFIGSALLMLLLMLITSRSDRFRARIITFAVAAAVVLALLIAVLLSFNAVDKVFEIRAELTQSYDVGHSGRFARQLQGLLQMFDFWNGVGPKRFWLHFGQDPHNVYLNGFYSYGWLGGLAQLALVLLTLVFGFRAVLITTPWQPTFIAVYATYAGVAAEGAIIDTDHWRHYFLLLGLIWGMIAATLRARQAALQPPHLPTLAPGGFRA